MLGSLDKYYGDNPIYVHLYRDAGKVVESYSKRYSPDFISGIMFGFGHGILQQPSIYSPEVITEVAKMYVEVVTHNIESFLVNKTKVIRFDVDDPEAAIYKIWEMGGIEGDIQNALEEWKYRYNQS